MAKWAVPNYAISIRRAVLYSPGNINANPEVAMKTTLAMVIAMFWFVGCGDTIIYNYGDPDGAAKDDMFAFYFYLFISHL